MKPPYTSRQGQFLAFIHHYTTLHGRTPGQARSIRLTLPPEKLPPLQGASASTGTQPSVRQAEGQQPTDTEAAMLHLGKIQIEDVFAHNDRYPLDDSEFIPLLDMLIESFSRAGLSALPVKKLRRRACELYHRCCQEAEAESTFEANLELMFSYLSASSRTLWLRWA